MESVHGKYSIDIGAATLAERLAGHHAVLIDIGTGDGYYVRHVAQACSAQFVIGIDACRENLRAISRKAPRNALYIIANALALPQELHGLAGHITINFPWGSLLAGLLGDDQALLDGLRVITRPGTVLEVRLNSGALVAAGWSLEAGGAQVRQVLCDGGFDVGPLVWLDSHALRTCPTSWAKRLAYGRDPHALYLRASAPVMRPLRLSSWQLANVVDVH